MLQAEVCSFGFPDRPAPASSVPQEFVKEINQFGGNMPDAIGIPEEQLAKGGVKMAVCRSTSTSTLSGDVPRASASISRNIWIT